MTIYEALQEALERERAVWRKLVESSSRDQENRYIRRWEEALAGAEFPPIPEKAQRVINAATFANFCPGEGGYSGGRSVEDCYQELHYSICDYYGVDLDIYEHPWWTEDEMCKAVKAEVETLGANPTEER